MATAASGYSRRECGLAEKSIAKAEKFNEKSDPIPGSSYAISGLDRRLFRMC